jgi:uncharacterized membrane protein
MPNLTNNGKNKDLASPDSPLTKGVTTRELYSGPIPHPDLVKKFGDIDSSFPERLMRMAEDNNKADITTRNRFSLAGLAVPLLGQIFSFLISCIGFGVAILFGIKGIEIGAVAAAIGGIAPVVIAALANLKSIRKE